MNNEKSVSLLTQETGRALSPPGGIAVPSDLCTCWHMGRGTLHALY